MSWDKNDGPWGKPPGGNNEPPNIEELIRKGREQFKKNFQPSLGSPKFVLMGLGILLGLWLLTGLYIVDPGEKGVEMRFGKATEVTDPGLHYHFPRPIEKVEIVDVEKLNSIDVGGSRSSSRSFRNQRRQSSNSYMLTGDENIISVVFTVQWKIKNPQDYLFNIRNQESTIFKVAESTMRDIIAQMPIQPALTEARGQIQQETKELLQKSLDEFQSGVEVVQIQLQQVDPPEEVIDAFRDVQRAKTDSERLRNEAETYRNSIIPVARGQAAQAIQVAQAYRSRVIAEAEGQSKRFLDTYRAYVVDRELFVKRTYLETMEQVLGPQQKIILDSKGGSQSVLPYLPLPGLKNQPNANKGAQ